MTESVDLPIPRIVISGLRGGSGKTILSLSLVTAFRKRGLRITPFKKGPDYIDAGWLAKAAGEPCYNLDLFMMTPEQVLRSFFEHTLKGQGARGKGQGTTAQLIAHDIALIEGNRGLYDGVDHQGTYSTAELSKLIKAPVIMIVDCSKATNTIAAMILGCQHMDDHVRIGGVVLNQVATARQESVIRKAVEGRCRVPVAGAIPRLKKDPFPERHMGLTPFQEHFDVGKSLDAVAEIGDKYIDVDAILTIAKETVSLKIAECGMRNAELQKHRSAEVQKRKRKTELKSEIRSPKSEIKIGVIRDSAFQFYYQENFEELEKRGVQLIEVSPLNENSLPEIDALYIGGGFPETHAVALAENSHFKTSLRSAIETGLPVYAECGGLMYLGKSLVLHGKTYPMVDALPVSFGLENKPRAHGYTIVEVTQENPYYPLKTVLKGHEFHYSHVLEPLLSFPVIKGGGRGGNFAFTMKRGKGIIDGKDGMWYKNIFATYTHLHALGAPEWADGLVRCAMKYKGQGQPG
ncbi:MAG: cobyrinate a,c-diamide synthase [Nitrospiraceae bacterium]|nr:MAG: cobyrinate a,c-diamide synthase [Nitrospiraceae bacterium]